MTDRFLDFSETAASLSVDNGLLVIRTQDQASQTVPISDIAAIVTSHRQVVFTQNLVAELGKAGAVLICCDERHHPVSMLLPLDGHFAQAERFRIQARAGIPVKKRIWQELIRAKVAAQGEVLRHLTGDDAGLSSLSKQVRSGDSGNIEAIAAQRYWPRLFGDPQFRRSNEADQRNGLLNYGYAVLRAITARAICAAGLHPSFGVGHTNRNNAFCLADDLMEPLRPLLDVRVANWCHDSPPDQLRLNRTLKVTLLATLAARYTMDGERRTLFDISTRRANSIVRMYRGDATAFACEVIEHED